MPIPALLDKNNSIKLGLLRRNHLGRKGVIGFQNVPVDLVDLHFSKEQAKGSSNLGSAIMSVMGVGFVSAFVASFSLIVISEFGDKTFFIAALMSMKHNPVIVFVGGLGALALMTVLSTAVGATLPRLVDRKFSHYGSIILFFIFGVRMLHSAHLMTPEVEHEELEEVEAELSKKTDSAVTNSENSPPIPFGVKTLPRTTFNHWTLKKTLLQMKAKWRLVFGCLSPVFLQAFSLTFLAEWGDRSQIATMALAASRDVWGVNIGAIIGHAICTGIAVLGGKILASNISERILTFAGGIFFLAFALVGLLFGL